jgi:hypothetical protein
LRMMNVLDREPYEKKAQAQEKQILQNGEQTFFHSNLK